MNFQVGDAVRLYAGTKPGRPGVIMRILPVGGRFAFAIGTSTDRTDVPHVRVDLGSRDATALGLTKTTWFTARGVEFTSPEAIERVTGKCPPALFLKLSKLIGF